MTQQELNQYLSTAIAETGDPLILLDELKSRRLVSIRDDEFKAYINQIDPRHHDVNNPIKRPDKKVKVDTESLDDSAKTVTSGMENPETGYKYEKVNRIALAIQKLIVKRAVSFLFGNPVCLSSDASSDNEKTVYKALKRIQHDVKEKSLNRKVARQLFTMREVAEVWFPVENTNSVYGFSSKFKLKCQLFSPYFGDKLYPYFNEEGDMLAFSRGFSQTNADGKQQFYFETYTNETHYLWSEKSGKWELVDGYPKQITIGKIPVVYGHQLHTEWHDVQNLIDRLETLLSNFADTNDYHASPKIFIKGELLGFAKKGESGAIIQGDENSSAEYLSWANAPESVKLEIETLLRMIYTITQTPDISFDSVKGLGNISGVALKLLFMDAHLKVADHQEVFDDYLQRRINIQKAFIGKFNTKLENDAAGLIVEPEIKPYMVVDEAAELKIWSDANGGNAIISQKASFEKAGLTSDPDTDYDQYLKEQNSNSQFSLNEPTQP